MRKKKKAYDNDALHLKKHKEFLERLARERNRWRVGENFTTYYLFGFIPLWKINAIGRQEK